MSCESCKKYREALERIYDVGCERMPAKELIRIAKQALDSIPEPVEKDRTCRNCGDKDCFGMRPEETNETCLSWEPVIEGKQYR